MINGYFPLDSSMYCGRDIAKSQAGAEFFIHATIINFLNLVLGHDDNEKIVVHTPCHMRVSSISKRESIHSNNNNKNNNTGQSKLQNTSTSSSSSSSSSFQSSSFSSSLTSSSSAASGKRPTSHSSSMVYQDEGSADQFWTRTIKDLLRSKFENCLLPHEEKEVRYQSPLILCIVLS
tara:strand:+ start:248 stop:778 length:531 start_codon:yes stop_codon:yes gene_type:complete